MLVNATFPRIDHQYYIFGIDYVPIIFVIAGIGVIGCGLTTIKKKVRPRTMGSDSELDNLFHMELSALPQLDLLRYIYSKANYQVHIFPNFLTYFLYASR